MIPIRRLSTECTASPECGATAFERIGLTAVVTEED